MLRPWRKHRKSGQRAPKRPPAFRPQVEALEDRLTPSHVPLPLLVITVTGVGDNIAVDGKVTLREAIQSVNNGADINMDVTAVRGDGVYGNHDTIEFDIAGNGPHEIALDDSLTITKPVTIDGYSQQGAQPNTAAFGQPINAQLKIVIKGVNDPNNPNVGFDIILIKTNDTTIKGLVIQNALAFKGIKIEGDNNKVQGNFIGTDVNGTAKVATGDGVIIFSGSVNLIGGTNKADRNLISGNTANGVVIWAGTDNDDANNNKVQGNYIGTDITGTNALANGLHGIHISDGSVNQIGGTEAEARNLISGNGKNGILVESEIVVDPRESRENVIQSNLIGTDATGTNRLGNGEDGVSIVNALSTIIDRNVISGNNGAGVHISGSAILNAVLGNKIGTNKDGTDDIWNSVGVLVEADSNFIGGSRQNGEGNIISGNQTGIEIHDGNGNDIKGNYVGVGQDGTTAVPNASDGIIIWGASSHNTVGGPDPDVRNVISENAASGVFVGAGSSFTRVEGNYIGVAADGTTAKGNAGSGVVIEAGASDTTVGGPTAAHGNVIANNAAKGIDDNGTRTTNKNNKVGKNMTGAAAPNQQGGIFVGGSDSLIEGNEVAYNGGPGVEVVAGSGHTITANSISLNTGLGIDLGDDGVTSNDLGDGDTGPNNLQNFPVLQSATLDSTGVKITWSLNSASGTLFTVEFFGNASANAEGETFLGSTQVTTNAAGDTGNVVTTLSTGSAAYVTATVTHPDGSTSEFSGAVVVTGKVGGKAWEDSDNDGLQDPGEIGAVNVPVELYDSLGTFIDSDLAAADGSYSFIDVTPGDYYVSFATALGYYYEFSPQDQGGNDSTDSDVDPLTGETAVFTVDPGQDVTAVDAGLVPFGRVGDFVFEDLDSDGVQDPSEPGIADVDVNLYASGGAWIDSTYTDFDGFYEFAGLTPGNYYVEFGLPYGYSFTLQDAGGSDSLDSDADATGQTAVFSLGIAQVITSIDAGLVYDVGGGALTGGGGTQTATLSGRAFADSDSDGVGDAGELGLAGLIVYLLDSQFNVVAKTFTGQDGTYIFKGVAAGSYAVRFVQPAMKDYSSFSPKGQGGDTARDSDVNADGLTAFFTLLGGMDKDDLDAGLVPLL